MYCKHCGKEIADDSKFCRYCGKAQDSTNEVQPEKPVGSIEPQSGSQSIKVELVTPKKVSEDGVRKGVLTILKEIGLIALFVGIAFLAKEITFQAINSQQFPEISQEDQKAFNHAVLKKKFPNGLPTKDEFISGNYDRSKYPEVYDINVGLEAAEFLNLGEFKYDEEVTSLSQLEDLNQFRKDSIYFHASDTSIIVFWIFLIGLPLLRYIILLIRWLSKSSPNNS